MGESPYARQFKLKERRVNKAIAKLARAPKKVKLTKLIPEWCNCGHEEFGCYPGDGECSCGVHKHHVHCKCGRISQVG